VTPAAQVVLRSCLHRSHLDGSGTEVLGPEALLTQFADCSAELSVRLTGGTALIAAYESVEFLKPLVAGDYVEIRGTLVAQGRRSRRIELEAFRSLQAPLTEDKTSGWVTHDPPELVARAVLVSVTPAQDGPAHSPAESPDHNSRRGDQ
jgi:3-aminobutyryl-CoA ammonia-lyase